MQGKDIAAFLKKQIEGGPRGQQKGPIWGGKAASPDWRSRLRRMKAAANRPRRQGIDRARSRDQIKSGRAPHQHDWVAITGPDKADGSVDVTIRCAVPGYSGCVFA